MILFGQVELSFPVHNFAISLFFILLWQKGADIKFWEAECFKIDPTNKKIHCHSDIGTNLDGTGEFVVDYDYLVIAVGARSNTFNTPGVEEHCHFLKVHIHHNKICKSACFTGMDTNFAMLLRCKSSTCTFYIKMK